LIYGLGGIIVPFIGIKVIDVCWSFWVSHKETK
jgi:high-affinity K+ transport system ATPase subunit B